MHNESKAIFEEYKEGLKDNLTEIKENMKTKVDQFVLEDYARKFDMKMFEQISYKLDKTDMKKNNTAFLKKIENLECRISKALVETLLDVQGSDGPLLTTGKADKCASCNQPTKKKEEKYKLKVIHENGVKFGTGGYSRIIASLPDMEIKKFRNTESKLPKVGGKVNVRKQFEEASRTFSKILDEELAKDNISGERIMRKADKVYNNMMKSAPVYDVLKTQ